MVSPGTAGAVMAAEMPALGSPEDGSLLSVQCTSPELAARAEVTK